MTQEEYLEYCSNCLNRDIDLNQGTICKLTNTFADFDEQCFSFQKDDSANQNKPPSDEESTINNQFADEVLFKLRSYQDINFAIAGGALVSIVCAILWAFITLKTKYQIGYMALGVGLFVGLGVRYFGAGIDKKFGYAGMILSLIGCLLGNFLSQVGFTADIYNQGFFETLTYFTLSDIPIILKESFQPVDLIFYGLAAYEGYKFSFRPIPDTIKEGEDLTPPFAKFRLPLTIISLLVITLIIYNVSQGTSGFKTFFYESGKKLSEGELVNGKCDGKWEYYFENGNVQLLANFNKAIEEGKWQWFNESGSLIKEGFFKNGLEHGTWIEYHKNNNISDSGSYYLGRKNGIWISYYEDGKVRQKGEFARDLQVGIWEFFYDSGKISSSGEFNKNERSGIWNYWDTTGRQISRIQFLKDDKSLILAAWDNKARQIVKDGNGTIVSLHPNGSTSEIGKVIDGNRVGLWQMYYSNQTKRQEGEYKDGVYYLNNFWDSNNKQMVKNGIGYINSSYEESEFFESGNYSNGLKSGIWKTYFQQPDKIVSENYYYEGKLSGLSRYYYESGSLFTKGSYSNGKQDGEWNWYYEDGSIQSSVNFSQGEKTGIQQFWSSSGVEVKEEIYKNGKLITEQIINSK
jgi:antitoxin component YwqK of YwqJK toxin-antitoxin module